VTPDIRSEVVDADADVDVDVDIVDDDGAKPDTPLLKHMLPNIMLVTPIENFIFLINNNLQ